MDFAPNDRAGVEGFLKEVEWQKTPLGAYVAGQRKTREEKARLVEEGRKDEERRKAEEKEESKQTNGQADGFESESEDVEDVEDDDMEGEGSDEDE